MDYILWNSYKNTFISEWKSVPKKVIVVCCHPSPPIVFLLTFCASKDMVVSLIQHLSTRVLTFGDMIAYDHCLLVVSNQKSKPPSSIKKMALFAI